MYKIGLFKCGLLLLNNILYKFNCNLKAWSIIKNTCQKHVEHTKQLLKYLPIILSLDYEIQRYMLNLNL